MNRATQKIHNVLKILSSEDVLSITIWRERGTKYAQLLMMPHRTGLWLGLARDEAGRHPVWPAGRQSGKQVGGRPGRRATRQGRSQTCTQADRQAPCLAGRRERQVGRVLRWSMQEEAGRQAGTPEHTGRPHHLRR